MEWLETPLAKELQQELRAAEEACKVLGVNPKTAGFLARHSRSKLPILPPRQAVLERYNAALASLKAAREEFIWNEGRKNVAHQMIAKGLSKEDVVQWLHTGPNQHAARQFIGIWNGLPNAPFQIAFDEIERG